MAEKGGKSSRFVGRAGDLEAIKREREFRQNPPEFEFGQGDDDGWGDDLFGDSGSTEFGSGGSDFGSGVSDFGSGGSDFGSSSGFGSEGGNFGSLSGGGAFGGGFGVQQSAPFGGSTEPKKEAADIAFDAAKVGVSGLWLFTTTFGKSFKKMDAILWVKVGRVLTIISTIYLFLWPVVYFLNGRNSLNIGIAGALGAGSGLFLLMKNIGRAKALQQERNGFIPETTSHVEPDSSDDFFSDFEEEESDFGSESDLFNEEEDEEVDLSAWLTESSGTLEEDPIVEQVNFAEAAEQLQNITPGTQTRAYLYEQLVRVLPNVTPDFANMQKFSEGSQEFLAAEKTLREAASQVGMKPENLPELLELKENAFIIQLKSTRPVGFKAQAVADEVANIYSYDDDGNKTLAGAFATVAEVGAQAIITIFSGDSNTMVSLKDAYSQVKDSILDPNNLMPVVLGVSEMGKVWFTDFKTLDSIIVSGMPRSGKSWLVQAIVAQLCAYMSPSELHFYILDPKDGISDYKNMDLPHIKRFETTHSGILQTLRWVVYEEGARRKKILGDAGKVNIFDYKRAGQGEELPFLYVIIDEMMTLAKAMDKDVKSEFQGLLAQLVSQLPALGIRIMMIPHRVVNDIVAKDVSTLVPCRINAKGNDEEVQATTGARPTDFKFKLNNVGDMAMKINTINSGQVFYSKGIALTTNNSDNVELFNYVRTLWEKLDPVGSQGSFASTSEVVNGAPVAGHHYSEVDVFAANQTIRHEDLGSDDVGESLDWETGKPKDTSLESLWD